MGFFDSFDKAMGQLVTPSRGACGRNLIWQIDYSNDTVIITGTGDMDDYSDSKSAPWNSSWRSGFKAKRIIIDDRVTRIGEHAFINCDMTEIKIPEGVTSIGEFAFSNCERLKEVTIPAGVTSIGQWTFNWCINLTKVKITDSVTSIGYLAFGGCFNLEEIKIPEGVTSIGEFAFSNCERLKEVTIPYSVTSIGEGVFDECKSLERIYCKRGTGFESKLRKGNNARIVYYDEKPKPAVKVETGKVKWVCKICGYVHEGDEPPVKCPLCKHPSTDFEKVVEAPAAPAQVNPSTPKPARKPTPAPEKLRWKVEGKTLTVGGVREIKFYRYGDLPWVRSVDAIQEIVIEAGVETISANAFSECKRLELLTIPASVKTIGDFAFTFCYCGDRSVNGGKNVIWSLADGVLMFKKNPDAKFATNFSIGAVSWRAVEGNVTGVKVERGITPDKRFFDWLGGLSSAVQVSF